MILSREWLSQLLILWGMREIANCCLFSLAVHGNGNIVVTGQNTSKTNPQYQVTLQYTYSWKMRLMSVVYEVKNILKVFKFKHIQIQLTTNDLMYQVEQINSNLIKTTKRILKFASIQRRCWRILMKTLFIYQAK